MTNTYNWRALLNAAIADDTQNGVAKKLGYSNTSVSLIINGKYKGKTDKFAARVIEVYGVIACPHLRAKIPLSQCRDTAHGKNVQLHHAMGTDNQLMIGE